MRRLPLELIERLRALRPKPETPTDHVGFVATAAGVYFVVITVIEVWRFVTADIIRPLWGWVRWWIGAGLLLSVPTLAEAQTPPYFNSTETNCTTTNSVGYVFCEDFETAGAATFNAKWTVCADLVTGPGGSACGNTFDGCTKGWAGLGNVGTAGGAIAGVGLGSSTAGSHNWGGGGTCSGSGAQHGLYPALANALTLYVRWYQKWPAGYAFGAEKVMTFNANNPGDPGIKWGNVHLNCGAGGTSSTGDLQWQPQPVSGFPITDVCSGTGVNITSGVWWALQARVTVPTNASTADAIVQIWADNCGSAGTSCTGSPTLQLNITNMAMNRNSGGEQVHNIWFEMFSNPQSTCAADMSNANCPILDNIVFATQGPIPFSGTQASRGFILRIVIPLLIALGVSVWRLRVSL